MAAYDNMDANLPGLLVGLSSTHTIDSRLADGDIGFGVVAFGSGDGEQCKTNGAEKPLGITCRTALNKSGYKDGDAVNVVRTGKIVAKVSAAINADTEVSVNTVTGEIIAKTNAVTGVAKTVNITVGVTTGAGDSWEVGDVASISLDGKIYSHTVVAADIGADGGVAGVGTALAGLIEDDDDCKFTAVSLAGVVTVTAKVIGAAANSLVITASKTSTDGTIAVGTPTAGVDGIANPNWYARTSSSASGELITIDLG